MSVPVMGSRTVEADSRKEPPLSVVGSRAAAVGAAAAVVAAAGRSNSDAAIVPSV